MVTISEKISTGKNLDHFLTFWTKYESLFHNNYASIFIYLLFAIFLSILLVVLAYALNNQAPDLEKLSAYECGFEPYEDSRHKFNIQFCIVSILFIIFDIEIMFLYPWCTTLAQLPVLGFWSMIDFILELGIAFVYVWAMQALEWE
jgi:NADH:ubiquinone oxidoreductase subunit 3 (subunit A)